MGKIKIIGTAQRDVPYDMMQITIKFHSWDKSVTNAINKTDSLCDDFLNILLKNNFDISKIHMDDIDINQKKVSDDSAGEPLRLSVSTSKSIIIPIPFNMNCLNFFKDTIKDMGADANLSVTYYHSNTSDIDNTLIEEAISDSRKKAEIAAAAMGQHIIGISEATINKSNNRYSDDNEDYELCDIFACLSNDSPTNQLTANTSKLSASVEIDWIIE